MIASFWNLLKYTMLLFSKFQQLYKPSNRRHRSLNAWWAPHQASTSKLLILYGLHVFGTSAKRRIYRRYPLNACRKKHLNYILTVFKENYYGMIDFENFKKSMFFQSSHLFWLFFFIWNVHILLLQCAYICSSMRLSAYSCSTCFDISIWNLQNTVSRQHDTSSHSNPSRYFTFKSRSNYFVFAFMTLWIKTHPSQIRRDLPVGLRHTSHTKKCFRSLAPATVRG